MLQWKDINTYEKLKIWIERTNNINEKDNRGLNILHYLCKNKNISIESINVLIEKV